jgi:hypothetical protein
MLGVGRAAARLPVEIGALEFEEFKGMDTHGHKPCSRVQSGLTAALRQSDNRSRPVPGSRGPMHFRVTLLLLTGNNAVMQSEMTARVCDVDHSAR